MLDVRHKPGCLSVAVSEAQVDRTLLILDTLVRELEKRAVISKQSSGRRESTSALARGKGKGRFATYLLLKLKSRDGIAA
jgi:hypothetical protein